MTTYEGVPSLGTFLAMKLTNRISRTRAKEREATPRTWVQTIVRLVLHLAGFSTLTMAGFTWNMTAGLIVAGLSCFVLSWLMSTSSENETAKTLQQFGPDPMATRR